VPACRDANADLAVTHTPELPYVDPHERRGRLYLALCRFSATRAGAWIVVHIAWKVDPLLLKRTDGRFSTAGPLAMRGGPGGQDGSSRSSSWSHADLMRGHPAASAPGQARSGDDEPV
jgi:hypothetical protein